MVTKLSDVLQCIPRKNQNAHPYDICGCISCYFIYCGKRNIFTEMFEPKDATVYGNLDIIAVIPEFNQKKDKPNHQ